ncbi:MAG TPA: sigma 54-interacting transcriptional regulator [Marinagarivorans sp.]
MTLITSDRTPPEEITALLEAYEYPAIAMDTDYNILAYNQRYTDYYGDLPADGSAKCYRVSHGYSQPCDQAGEDCPLAEATTSGERAKVLHIHQTPRGKEYVDVELTPIFHHDKLAYFIELLKPVTLDAQAEKGRPTEQSLVGKSTAFARMLGTISKVAECGASVLLLGESGVGKELVAQTIHRLSNRQHKPLVTLECAGLTDTLFESELFGHVKGAFTGAQNAKKGLVEQADGGTLFLDEIADVPLSMQVKLLRLLETGTYRRVGSAAVQYANFRLICATHLNIQQMIADGKFRQDLFYRINVFPIRIPPLRERLDDIADISVALMGRMKTKRTMHLTEGAVARLKRHHFPGNIRELRNLLARAVVLSKTNIIDADLIEEAFNIDAEPVGAVDKLHTKTPQMNIGQSSNTPIAVGYSAAMKTDLAAATEHQWLDLKTAELQYLNAMLAAHDGDKQKTAQVAGISVRSLYRKLGG